MDGYKGGGRGGAPPPKWNSGGGQTDLGGGKMCPETKKTL